MNIWLVETGEALPIECNKDRLMRYGMLSQRLLERGHQVTWWTSRFDHRKKQFISINSKLTYIQDNFYLMFLDSCGYKKNISVSRLIDHYQLGREFSKLAKNFSKPDVIFCGYPTIELCKSAVLYGRKYNVPVIVDVQDLWPDIFLSALPRFFHGFSKIFLYKYFSDAKYIFKNCNRITAVSDGYLKWALRLAEREMINDSVFSIGYNDSKESITNLSESKIKLFNLGVDPRNSIVWFVGTFGHTYDLKTIIEAFNRSTFENTQLVISGSGEMDLELRSLAGANKNIIFTGWIDSAMHAAMSGLATIGLMAYARGAPQGLPNKLFEYMAAGLPIISSLEGESCNFISKHRIGFSFSPGDIIGFEKMLRNLLASNSLRKDMARAARYLHNTKYSGNVIYEKLSRYIERVSNI